MHTSRRVIVSLFVISLFFGCWAQQEQYSVLTPDFKPTASLLQLLEYTGVACEPSLESVVQATQQSWLRKAGTEVWHIPKNSYNSEAAILDLLAKLGFIHEIAPEKKQYDHVVVLGALFSTMVFRFKSVLSYMIEYDIHPKDIIFLASNRPCYEDKGETEEIFRAYAAGHEITDLPCDECSMLEWIYRYTSNVPESIRAIPTTYICAPMKYDAVGKPMRPNTKDTIELWMQEHEIHGESCLVISSQPFVLYQDSVVKSYVPQDVAITTVGKVFKKPENTAALLDTVARYLYQEQIRCQLLSIQA